MGKKNKVKRKQNRNKRSQIRQEMLWLNVNGGVEVAGGGGHGCDGC